CSIWPSNCRRSSVRCTGVLSRACWRDTAARTSPTLKTLVLPRTRRSSCCRSTNPAPVGCDTPARATLESSTFPADDARLSLSGVVQLAAVAAVLPGADAHFVALRVGEHTERWGERDGQTSA